MKTVKIISGWTAVLATCVMMFTITSCTNQEKANGLTDPEIASVAVTANQIDIDYGKIALDKSENPEVKKFAETMMKDHQDIIDKAVALVEKLGVTPKDNAFTQTLLDGKKATTEQLNELIGAEFDVAYIENEVAYHKAVINAVKDSLIPSTENAELKKLLESAVPLLQHHLEMAEEADKKIKKTLANIPKLNDAEIASVAVTANKIDVSYGKIALQKSENPQVLKFAKVMIKDHSEIMNQALELAQKLKITPKVNGVTQSLLEGQKSSTELLNSAEGEAFNAAYIDNEVAFHQAVINALKNVLIPQAQNEELKKVLVDITPLLENHLEMMKVEQAKIEA